MTPWWVQFQVTPTTLLDDPRVRSFVDSLQFGPQHGTRLSGWFLEQWDDAPTISPNVEAAAEALRRLVELGTVQPVRYDPTASLTFFGLSKAGRRDTWEGRSRTSMEVISWWFRAGYPK